MGSFKTFYSYGDSMTIEVMKQALEDMACMRDMVGHPENLEFIGNAITALRQAIEQAEKQEPVAKVILTETLGLPTMQWLDLTRQFDFKGGEFLYTSPPRKEWVGLTDQDVQSLEDKHLMSGIEFDGESGYWAVYRAIEAKLKEKNT